ncbi:MAG TPA: FtsL-like putative cell division protein, partial [Flavisolibacter sp.]
MENKKKVFKLNRWLSYQSIVRQVPFFLFLAALAVVYIYNGHNADKTIRRIGKATSELKDLQGEYKSVTGDVLLRSRQSEMVETVKPLGLLELT